jgi:hypothetical protein
MKPGNYKWKSGLLSVAQEVDEDLDNFKIRLRSNRNDILSAIRKSLSLTF